MDWSAVHCARGALRSLQAVIFGCLAMVAVRPPPLTSCEWLVRNGDYRCGVAVCLASFARSDDEHDLSWAAQAHMYLGELDQAESLARRLLGGRLDGDGNRILSYVMLQRRFADKARIHAAAAFAAHRRTGDERSLAGDAVLLAQAAWKLGDYTASLAAADEALEWARRRSDPRQEVFAQLARADALRRMGDLRGAADALRGANDRAVHPCDQAWARLKYGMCLMEDGQDSLASHELAHADDANRQCGSREISISVALNQVALLRWKDPARASALLDEAEEAGGAGLEILLWRAYLAADRGALAEADGYLARAAGASPPDADWPWEIARACAELLEQIGGTFGDLRAELRYRQAIAMVASLRASARSRSAYLVASHRGPYEGLVALLARRGRWRDALAVVLELDASDMLRATAAEAVVRDRAPLDLPAPAPDAIARPPSTTEDVLAAWRSRELVIAIAPSRRQIGPGRERAYRLRIDRGEVTGEDVGDAAQARAWADKLFADPGDREAARALGRMIVPPGPGAEPLHVLGVGPLGKVPLAALRRDDGSLSVAGRPLVRVLALRATGPESGGAGAPVIVADPRGDLPGAAREGALVAQALGPEARVSGSGAPISATRARLWAARDAELLHVAAHVGGVGTRRTLHLADGEVDAAELVQASFAPRLAVLAGCGSAAAKDEEGWGSIAAALLEAGTSVVIATDRSVGDAASLSVMRDFYAQPDWRADPARALARVQRALDARAATSGGDDATRPRAWAAFSVLRRPPTIPGSPIAQQIR